MPKIKPYIVLASLSALLAVTISAFFPHLGEWAIAIAFLVSILFVAFYHPKTTKRVRVELTREDAEALDREYRAVGLPCSDKTAWVALDRFVAKLRSALAEFDKR